MVTPGTVGLIPLGAAGAPAGRCGMACIEAAADGGALGVDGIPGIAVGALS